MSARFDFDKSFDGLVRLIKSQGAGQWIEERVQDRDEATLTYLGKFAYMTGLLNKADLKAYLDVDSRQAKELVRQWYKDHREKGCGTC